MYAGLAEPGRRETPGRESRTGRPRRGRLQGRPPCTRARRARSCGETPGWESRTGRPRRGRLQGGRLVSGLAEPGRRETPGRESRTGPASARPATGRPPCTRARRARSSRDARPGIAERPASARPSTGAALYPGSPSPVSPRRPAGNLGENGLGEAVYRGGAFQNSARARPRSRRRRRNPSPSAGRPAPAQASSAPKNGFIRWQAEARAAPARRISASHIAMPPMVTTRAR